MFKSTFLQKMNSLKLNGKSQILFDKIYKFIDDNIEEFYQNFKAWKRNLSKADINRMKKRRI